jgi:hypothetical protein
VRLSLAKIEALAPDQGSLDAARKLLKPASWPTLAEDRAGLIWGECQGSGATPYRISVTEIDAGYKCSCPSRKFPCKHSLALMWLRAEGKVPFVPGTPPDWVTDWLSRRRGPVAGSSSATDKPKASIASTAEVEEVADPKAEARAAAARERNRIEREKSIANGLDELDTWLVDQIDAGIAAFPAKSSAACRVMAQRLFDAKASGLAIRVDTLPARLFVLPEARRATAAVKELGTLHLLADAYRRREQLSSELKADVRQEIGWTVSREALLAEETALRVKATWRVWQVRHELQPDKLRRVETWLYGNGHVAVLIDYYPVSAGAAWNGLGAGSAFDAELIFYPSPVPLRALIVEQTTGSEWTPLPLGLPEQNLETAFSGYEEALGRKPWLDNYPLMFRGGRVRRSGDTYFVTDGNLSLPLSKKQEAYVWPLLSFDSIDCAGLWNGFELVLCCCDTPIGRWQ